MSDGFQSCKSNDKHSLNSIGIQFLSLTARLLFEFTYYGSRQPAMNPDTPSTPQDDADRVR